MTGHTYPSKYGRGQYDILDAAWDIVDSIEPGVLTEEQRAWMAGQIVGTILKFQDEQKTKDKTAWDEMWSRPFEYWGKD